MLKETVKYCFICLISTHIEAENARRNNPNSMHKISGTTFFPPTTVNSGDPQRLENIAINVVSHRM